MESRPDNAGKPQYKDPKNIAIALLVLIALVMGFFLLRDKLPAEGPEKTAEQPAASGSVSVVEVRFDKENNSFVDIIFNEPVGKDDTGEILGRDPATITPSVNGAWQWKSPNVLTFQASYRFNMATDYRIKLNPENFLKSGETLGGKTEFSIRTDKFRVVKASVSEEPVPDERNTVTLNGTVDFNYPVDPNVLARKISLREVGGGGEGPGEVPLKLITEYWHNTMKWRSGPLEKAAGERTFELVIVGDLTPTDGNVTLGDDFIEKITLGSRDKLAVRGAEPKSAYPKSSVTIGFSSFVSPEIASDYISVEPKVSYAVKRVGNDLILTGDFVPGKKYNLKIAEGMPALDDAVLREEYKKEIRFANLDPTIEFESPGMFLDSNGTKAVALKSININTVDLTVDKVYLNNLFFLFQSYGYSVWRDEFYQGSIGDYFGGRVSEAYGFKIAEKQNQEVRTVLDLKKYIPSEPGLYQVGILPQGQYQGVQKWVLITDIGIVAKKGKDGFLVWTSSFSTLDPVAGASVRIISDKNQVIAEGTTDSKGLFETDKAAGDEKKGRPYMVTVQKGGDFSFLLLDNMLIDTSGLDVSGAVPSLQGYSAYVYGERDIYRPGETAEGVAVVRDANLNIPAKMPVILRQIDARGRVARTVKETLSPAGMVPFAIDIPEFAPTGNNTIEVKIGDEVVGQYMFQVEEFIPDRIKVRIGTDESAVGVGKELRYDVSSAYLFGPPASGLSVETLVDLVERPFLPEDYKGYVFTNPDRTFESKEIFKGEGTLDVNGSTSFTASIPDGLRPPSSLQAQISARVQETGGRGVNATRRVNVDPYPYYIGLKLKDPEKYAEPGKEVELEYVALATRGDGTEEVNTGELKAEFYKDVWNTVLRQTPSRNYKYESKRDSVLVNSFSMDGGSPKGSFTVTPPEFGSYRVVLTDPKGGSSTQVQFYASGWGFSPWAVENPARLDLGLEKKEYMPGETANLQVRAPFSGKLLVTVERDEVYYTETYSIDGNTAAIKIPVSDKYRPNAYVTATLVRGVNELEPGSAGRAFGAIPINVDRTANKAPVEITAPEEIRPLTPLEVGVKTLPGATVTVAVVDEGILQLIDQKTADPFTFFYRKLALEVASYDTFSLLLPDISIGLSPKGGGFAARKEMQFLSTQGIRRVKPVAFWSGPLEADGDGNVSYKIDMPQFQGAVRIMAVAARGEEFGSAEKFTRVKSPIVLLPTVPRFFSLNESVVIPVSVRNDTKKDGTITVDMKIEGPASTGVMDGAGEKGVSPGSKEARLDVEIPDGGERAVYFVVDTEDATGAVAMEVTASGNGESTSSNLDVPVLPDLPAKREENIGRIDSHEFEIPVASGDYRPGTIRRDLYVSRLPLIQFSGKLDYLLQYPYGCLEQITSRVFPLIYLSDIAREIDPSLFEKGDPAVLVQDGIRQIASMQVDGGGFSLWPGGASAEPWASIYAAHFLVEARKAGYFVDESLYSNAVGYARMMAKAQPELGTNELELAVYALYVLSRDGKPDMGTMDFIRDRYKDELSVESRALLGGAYAGSGDASALEQLLKGINDVEEIARQTGGNFNSTIRSRAILLLAILDLNPDDPRVPALVDRLSRDARLNQWWTTQESSFALLAIGEFVKKQAEAPPFVGTVTIGGKQVATFESGKILSLTGIEGDRPIVINMDEEYKEGSAFFTVLTSGTPTPKGFKPVEEGLSVLREFLTRDGAPVDPANVAQGDLIVVRTKIQSGAGPLENVVIENLLPSGFEVENPRLKTTETLKWATGNTTEPEYMDIRDDRILIFTDLPDAKWYNFYALLRVVNPGTFAVPPVQAEAMYSPNIRFTGKLGEPFEVKLKQ
ncbi:MAG TPA: MG2 domain-containing protein [Thermodesulfobacteriota bacterium]|nr:MG2 domain-containing protein [Thermodesulfobacteriota bacterium]